METVISTGSNFLAIIRAALRRRHDLVVKTVSSEGIFHRTFFGSTDTHLLRKCPTPPWLIKTEEPPVFRRILVLLDPNAKIGIKHDLGINLLKLGTSLAEMDAAELVIVHAWQAYAEEKLKACMDSKKFHEYLHAWRQESSNRVRRFTSTFQREIKPDCVHLIHGKPGFVVPKFAKDHEVDLVVMGTLGRFGQKRDVDRRHGRANPQPARMFYPGGETCRVRFACRTSLTVKKLKTRNSEC